MWIRISLLKLKVSQRRHQKTLREQIQQRKVGKLQQGRNDYINEVY